MRERYHLPWLAEGESPSEQDERTIRNIEYLSRDVALHSRCTRREVLEQIYRLIGHDCVALHRTGDGNA